MYRQTSQAIAVELALARVETDANRQTELAHPRYQSFGTTDCATRSVKGGQQTVTSRIDDATSVLLDDCPSFRLTSPDQFGPRHVAQPGGQSGRVDDVREQNCRQDSVVVNRLRAGCSD